MRLDRNNNADGKSKYAIVNLRKIPGNPQTAQELAAAILANPESVEFGRKGEQDEFFVLKLKDKFADWALAGYKKGLLEEPSLAGEYYDEINELHSRAGMQSPFCKVPD